MASNHPTAHAKNAFSACYFQIKSCLSKFTVRQKKINRYDFTIHCQQSSSQHVLIPKCRSSQLLHSIKPLCFSHGTSFKFRVITIVHEMIYKVPMILLIKKLRKFISFSKKASNTERSNKRKTRCKTYHSAPLFPRHHQSIKD